MLEHTQMRSLACRHFQLGTYTRLFRLSLGAEAWGKTASSGSHRSPEAARKLVLWEFWEVCVASQQSHFCSLSRTDYLSLSIHHPVSISEQHVSGHNSRGLHTLAKPLSEHKSLWRKKGHVNPSVSLEKDRDNMLRGLSLLHSHQEMFKLIHAYMHKEPRRPSDTLTGA